MEQEVKKEYNNDRFLFVLNPAAGDGENGDAVKEIGEFAKRSGITFRIMTMGRENNDLKLRNQLKEFKPATVVACGGDGTVNFVTGQILGKGIRLGILPLGSFNGMAYEMGIPTDIGEALDILIEGKGKKTDVIRVTEDHICLHLSDLGTNARVIKRKDAGRLKGFAAYFIQYFKELGRTKKFKCRIKTDEGETSTKAIMVILANAGYYGTGINVNPAADVGDGRFEVVVIRSYPFWFLFYILINLLVGRSLKDRWTNIISCSKAWISVKPGQELQVDGEWAGLKHTVSPEVLEDKIEVIA